MTTRLLLAITALLPGWMAAQPRALLQQPAARVSLPARTFDIPIDTNSAGAYYQLGVILLRARPADAARAFYWASRLDPALAEAMYGRGVAIALMLRDHGPERAKGGAFLVPREDYRRVDSLRAQAYLRNPFVQITAERALLPPLVTDPVAMDPYFRGWLYLISGSPHEAVKSYAEALVRQPQAKKIHAERARAFYAMEQYDSSLTELNVLLASLRRADDSTLVHFYRSKANLEYMVGIVQAKRGDLSAARAALGRSLSEDLAFHPARSLLAYLDLVEGDTTSAIVEFENAVQLKPDDPVLRYNFGVTLLGAGQLDRAEAQLRRAIEIEPFYALPRFYLGRTLELRGRDQEAMDTYREFYARAAREDPAAAWTAKKLNIVEREDRHQP
ncbi:MAG TPA: tetratricopeptide repeat protein [Gemmatimonadaceae bacterium]|nr:tetratricopeptide repeat protein [Gemmatimonadaceae bacterium]